MIRKNYNGGNVARLYGKSMKSKKRNQEIYLSRGSQINLMTIPRSLRHFAEGKATLLHAGKKDTEKAEGYTYNKSAALFFFPAAGYGGAW